MRREYHNTTHNAGHGGEVTGPEIEEGEGIGPPLPPNV